MGVVLDVMIHDIDLVLSMVRSPLRKVDALGFSVLGGHEDVANARLEFECGCVATLSASRVSYEQVRRMQVWSAEGFAAVDFAARTATLVRPSETLRRRQFDVDALTPEQVEHYRQHFAEEHLPKQTLTFDAVDALALEQDDFVESIRSGREPRVRRRGGPRRPGGGRADSGPHRRPLLGRLARRPGRPAGAPPPARHPRAALRPGPAACRLVRPRGETASGLSGETASGLPANALLLRRSIPPTAHSFSVLIIIPIKLQYFRSEYAR